MVQTTVALRIDVDTRRGLDEGVPRLLDLFRRIEVRASFFVTMGPDRSGAAIRRAWRPSFLWKMWRTNALRLYGPRTLLSGTLLPARPVGAGAPELLRHILAEGHEVAPHGFDHVGWQDGVARWSAARIRSDMAAAVGAFETVFGTRPEATAAPGWRTTDQALSVQEEFGFRYASDVRGLAPFRPRLATGPLKTLQIPTTMPTLDELLGAVPDVVSALERAIRPGLNVLTVHAEVEGGDLRDAFERFLLRARAAGVGITRLGDAATRAPTIADPAPVLPIARGRARGRSGWVATQEAVEYPA